MPEEEEMVHVRDEESGFNTLLTENIKQLGSKPAPSSAITHSRKPKPHSQPRSIIKSQRNIPSRVARVDVHSIGNIPHLRPSHNCRCMSHCRGNSSSSSGDVPHAHRRRQIAVAVAPLATSPTMHARITTVAISRTATSI